MTAFDLGVGVVMLPGLVPYLEAFDDLVTVLEVEPQTFWMETGEPVSPYRLVPDLLSLRALVDCPILAHGVSCPVGTSRVPSVFAAELFAESVRMLEARMASEHLAFNEAVLRGEVIGSAFFLPPRQTPAGVAAAVAAIRRLRTPLDVPFLVETPVNYLQPRRDEMSDGAYVGEVAERADCGILLDLHNIWANERNGRQRVEDYLAELPLERVWEVHLAGGFERSGYWLDAHSGAMADGLVELAERVLPRLPNVRAVVFEMMPEFLPSLGFEGMRRELETIHRMVERVRRVPRREFVAIRRSVPPADAAFGDVEEWEGTLATLAISHPVDSSLGADLAADPGIALLRELVAAGRSGRIASSLPITVRLLLLSLPREDVDALLARYAASTTPSQWGAGEGRRFAEWLGGQQVGVRWLREAVAIDLAAIERTSSESVQQVRLGVDPTPLLAGILRGVVPEGLVEGDFVLSIT